MDTIQVLKSGKRPVIRLLYSARMIFMDGGDWSVYSRIMWEDYIIWCQRCREKVLTVLAEEMERIELDLDQIGFGLDEIEREFIE